MDSKPTIPKKDEEHKCRKCWHADGPFSFCQAQQFKSHKVADPIHGGHRLIVVECTGYERVPQEVAA